jgi:hypothetical protein
LRMQQSELLPVTTSGPDLLLGILPPHLCTPSSPSELSTPRGLCSCTDISLWAQLFVWVIYLLIGSTWG